MKPFESLKFLRLTSSKFLSEIDILLHLDPYHTKIFYQYLTYSLLYEVWEPPTVGIL